MPRSPKQKVGLSEHGDLTGYRNNPVGFVETVLGEFLWSRQRQIAEAVRDNRRVAVPSCHDAGKSFIASRIACWWLSTAEPGSAFVVTSAPTFAQVRAILWREIGKAHAKGGLPGRVNQTEWLIDEQLVGFGRKPGDTEMTAFQGIHAERVLVIFDEACGVRKPLWDAADTLVANEGSRLFAIGNPDDPASSFGAACRPGSGWEVLPIDAFETPNFTEEPLPAGLGHMLISRLWVEEKRLDWGEASNLWTAKVRGRFPPAAADGLFPDDAVRIAMRRRLEPGEPIELGVDVARFGTDQTVIAVRRGARAEILEVFSKRDTMETVGAVIEARRATGAIRIKVDDSGVGGGVTDRLRELGEPVVPINGAERPLAPERFHNLRAEMFWGLRTRCIEGDLSIGQDDRLAAELMALRWRLTSRAQIRIEGKDELKARGIASPDRADALALAFAVSPKQRAGLLEFYANRSQQEPST